LGEGDGTEGDFCSPHGGGFFPKSEEERVEVGATSDLAVNRKLHAKRSPLPRILPRGRESLKKNIVRKGCLSGTNQRLWAQYVQIKKGEKDLYLLLVRVGRFQCYYLRE